MRLTISSTTLASRLSALSKVFNSKNSMPILNCYLFEVNGDTLTITASDSENVMTTQLHLDEADSEGTFAVNNRTILDAVKELPEQPLTLDVDMSTYAVKVIYLNGMYNFTAQSGEEFPHLQPLNEGASSIVIDSKTLLADISRSIFATANEELRPVMNGIYFDIQPDGVYFVATDGRKLVRIKNTSIQGNAPSNFILPPKPASLLKNLLPKESNDVKINFNQRNAVIHLESAKLICRLIEGRYPNYNSVIPTQNPYHVTVDRQAFLSTIKRILVFSSQSSALVKLHLEDNKIIVSGQDFDFSTSAEEMLPCSYQGNVINIGFSGTFLVDILNNLVGDNVLIELADPSRAGVLVPVEQNENEEMLMLLMPMMLNE